MSFEICFGTCLPLAVADSGTDASPTSFQAAVGGPTVGKPRPQSGATMPRRTLTPLCTAPTALLRCIMHQPSNRRV